ncbi:hypothetical protein [Candidatus Palauibacter sp.]|uniref:hypothetical protein n=1 Tax=Candidatus Palauibacter sp. TaxID=3101350 RepID=UPI003B515822
MTVTAADGQATAAQGFNVEVEAAATNQAPVAVGTIPGSRLQIGGTSTIDVAGYFSDADGDELTYAGASSNESVATVAMEGSTATITAIATGDAVVTVTASDGSASVSQGFRIDVPAGPQEATVVISRLLDANRQQISDPTGISGTIYAVLDVQSRDETWTEIGLTLNGETVTPLCRGTGGSSADAIAGPGLAAAGQVEIECALKTNAVVGECAGMPLMPKYANGAYELSAFLTTDDDATREVVATLPIALDNSNRVDIAFSPGSEHVLDRGVPTYGGPSGEANMNTFHACPVSFDGTEVGKISLVAKSTGPGGAQPHQPGTSLSFTAPTTMPAESFKGMPADREGLFTWDANSAWNGDVEDEGPGGREHWVEIEKIENAAGLDVRNDFATAPAGPYYFDFKAPVPGAILIGDTAVVADAHYSDKAYPGTVKRTNTIRLSSITDGGVGVDSTTIMIGVGDCSAEANNTAVAKANLPDRTMTPFEAVHTFAGKDQGHVSALDEEDATRDGPGKDSNGLDCYVAELTGLADNLGNAWMGGDKTPDSWLQTDNFGVDKTAAMLDDIEPDLAGLVFNQAPEMEFEVRNPDLGSGDAGTALDTLTSTAKWGKGYADPAGKVNLPKVGIEATVDLDASVTAMEGAKSVRVTVSDGAVPPNLAGYTFGFVFDKTPATYSIGGRTQGDINPGGATSVQVSVEGTVTDEFSNLETAELRLLFAPGGTCYADTLEELEALEALPGDTVAAVLAKRDAVIPSRLGVGKNRHKRDLADGTAKSASLNSTFTIARANPTAGPETYCFRLDVEDVARTAGARASSSGNAATFTVGPTFTVNWPDDRPPAGPTFNIQRADDDATPTEFTAIKDSLPVAEGSAADADGNSYWVSLANVAKGKEPTEAAPVTVTITPDAPLTVTPSTLTFNGTADSARVMIAAPHDLNNDSEPRKIAHTATGYGSAELRVRVTDDDYRIIVSQESVSEDAAAVPVVVTLEGPPTATAVSVEFGAGGSADTDDFTAITPAEFEIAAGKRRDADTVMVDAADDGNPDELNDFIELTVSGSDINGVYYAPAEIMIIDDDPDIQLSLSQSTAGEADDAVALTITATVKDGKPAVGGIVSATVVIGADNEAVRGEDYSGPASVTLTIDAGARSGTATATVTIIDDGVDDDDETITFSAVNVTVGDKAYTFESVKLTIVDNDDTP